MAAQSHEVGAAAQ